MANCVEINSNGLIQTSASQPAQITDCQSFVMISASEYSHTQIDSSESAQFFGFGFSMVIASYLSGLAVGSILKVVRRAA